MTPFQEAWTKTYLAEQGYSNNSNDPGGETNHGITFRIARAYGYQGRMIDLTKGLAEVIAKNQYWDALRLDDIAAISKPIAYELFDTNFNFWFGASAKFFQRALNALNRDGKDYPDLNVDGNIGKTTIEAFKAYMHKRPRPAESEVVMLRILNAQQASDYLRQCGETVGKEDFFYGWLLNRVVI